MSVKRYWQDTSDDWREVGESPEGDFVLWADYDTLAARLAKAEAALRKIADWEDVARDFAMRGAITTIGVDMAGIARAALADEPQKGAG